MTFGLCACGSCLELEKLLNNRGLLLSVVVVVLVVVDVVLVILSVLILLVVVFVAAAGVFTMTPVVAARFLFTGVRSL